MKVDTYQGYTMKTQTHTHTEFWQRIAAGRSYKIDDLKAINAELLAALKRLQEAPCPDRYDKRWTEAEAVTAKAERAE